ncbi:uncharacterized protein LOC123311714 [Coccinella septempunctata]|uniref:uncharacterized protein LOC123311714 n=1 Tax=Coccinella septempunctata TaxID=41139 RepID=UPI001D07F302|nr:uncharacterized protein LOC123311714 [Coccinella septempunctata]
MEEKLGEQMTIGQDLSKILSSLKKDGSARNTEEYFKKKSMMAADLLNKFQENHNELRKSLDEEHSYFKQDLDGQISKCYQEIKNYINTWQKSTPMSEEGTLKKMQYLKSQTRGEAAKLIQHLEVSSRNYPIAWELIKRRYNNNRLLFSKYADNILNLPILQQESAASIKKLHDTVQENLRAIENMGITAEQLGNNIIAHMLLKKLDSNSRRLYEQSTTTHKDIQELADLLEFLENRFQSLEALRGTIKKSDHPSTGQRHKFQNYHSDLQSCSLCNSNHEIFRCQEFKDMSVKERNDFVRKQHLCKNCLKHPNNTKCPSKNLCFKCNNFHYSSLHWENYRNFETNLNQQGQKQDTSKSQPTREHENGFGSHLGKASNNNDGPTIPILATAFVNVKNNKGYHELKRVLIDPGSQVSFITEGAANTLGMPKQRHHANITGLGSCDAGTSKWKIHTVMKPRFSSDFKLQAELYILPKLTSSMPQQPITADENWSNVILADPTYYKPGKIDILLGIDLYTEIVQDGVKISKNGLLAQNTELGWILSGSTSAGPQLQITSMIATTAPEIQITKFWEIEEADTLTNNNSQESPCQEFFKKTYTRNQDGTYTIEKKFEKDEKLEAMYKEFMWEYIELKHMTPANQTTSTRYYIPHQAVIKEDRETTKLRVVFDASQKSSTGIILNDILHTGPKLQQDLLDILLRWRKYEIALTADVEKMYWQVKLHEDDQTFHTILWRFNKNDPIQEYQLTTVTYGTAPAAKFPRAAELILEDFYVDDFLSGSHNKEEAQKIRQEVKTLLLKGGFNIRKWKSNLTLNDDTSFQDFNSREDITKILGIKWSPQNDNFQYTIKQTSNRTNTKRQVLSEIASIFDPLGLMAPIVIKAKIIMQDICKTGKKWDEAIPTEIQTAWDKFKEELPIMENLQLPRWFQYNPEQPIELHGFCDASQRAYGAAIYTKAVKTPSKQNVFIVNRVNKVHRLLGQVQWNYVKSEENPADLLSRGALPSKLQKNTLWWNGPAWLKTSSSEIKRTEEIPKEIVMNNEEFQELTVFTTKTNGPLELLTKFSSWKKTKRVMAYCKRFIDNCRSRNATELPKKRVPPFITPTELQWAKTTLIKLVQNEHFQEELTRFNNNLTINYWTLGRVTRCHPGNDGIVRVATIRCKDGKEIRRPITKICILPVEQEERRNDKTNKVGPSSKNRLIQTLIMITLLCVANTKNAIAHHTIHKLPPGFYVEHLGKTEAILTEQLKTFEGYVLQLLNYRRQITVTSFNTTSQK